MVVVALMMVSSPLAAQPPVPWEAVFEIQVAQRSLNGQVATVSRGTGFFIASNGTAVTNSHVVARAVNEPSRYRLIAVIHSGPGLELFDVNVGCTNALIYDADTIDPTTPVHLGRDVALIHVVPSTLPFRHLSWSAPAGGHLSAEVHTGRLPDFPFLPIAGEAIAGTRIWVIGFGPTASPLSPQVTAGSVIRVFRARDRTRVLSIGLQGRAEHGFSGSPVVDERREVVGLWTWGTSGTLGAAQSNEVLLRPCE